MALPTWLSSAGGQALTASGTINAGSMGTGNVGDIIIVQIMQDGTGTTATATPGTTNIEDLAGTDNALTFIGEYAVGSPTAAKHILYIGRTTITGAVSCDLTTSSGDDCYCNLHRFQGVNAGTTASTVYENGSAGFATNEAGTSTTVPDAAVITLGADRLALNFVGINDDLTGLAVFTGMSGGTWVLPGATAQFESSTGTDGTVAMFTANMASAGTIDGGTDTITSDGWGVTGFALKPAAAPAAALVTRKPWPALQAVPHSTVW